jgi:hypothetical protein
VGAEQGAIGIAAYAAILVTALMTLSAGLGSMPGVRRERDSGEGAEAEAEADAVQAAARAGILAAFVALAVHTFAYAGFFEDPIAWVLLAIGGSLAGRRGA